MAWLSETESDPASLAYSWGSDEDAEVEGWDGREQTDEELDSA